MSMIPKHLMSEEDVKLQFITPAVTAKWDISKITMETKLTDGKINLKGNFVVREKPKRADYEDDTDETGNIRKEYKFRLRKV